MATSNGWRNQGYLEEQHFEAINTSKGAHSYGVKWVYKIEQNAKVEVEKQARLVAQGYKQPARIDYGDVFLFPLLILKLFIYFLISCSTLL